MNTEIIPELERGLPDFENLPATVEVSVGIPFSFQLKPVNFGGSVVLPPFYGADIWVVEGLNPIDYPSTIITGTLTNKGTHIVRCWVKNWEGMTVKELTIHAID